MLFLIKRPEDMLWQKRELNQKKQNPGNRRFSTEDGQRESSGLATAQQARGGMGPIETRN